MTFHPLIPMMVSRQSVVSKPVEFLLILWQAKVKTSRISLLSLASSRVANRKNNIIIRDTEVASLEAIYWYQETRVRHT